MNDAACDCEVPEVIDIDVDRVRELQRDKCDIHEDDYDNERGADQAAKAHSRRWRAAHIDGREVEVQDLDHSVDDRSQRIRSERGNQADAD